MSPYPGKHPVLLWALAVLITLSSVVYQRMTGPTYPIRGKVTVEGERVSYKLIRSHETTGDAAMRFRVPDRGVRGELVWRRYRSNDTWQTIPLEREGDELIAVIPRQPAAGKVAYRVVLIPESGERIVLNTEPALIRFKGPVPAVVLIPHILFMFIAMLFSNRAGLEAIARGGNAYRLAVWTTVLFFTGGLILGPIVQKFAFGAFWTGWPFGHDLTDNKTAVVFLFWLAALWRGRDPAKARMWIVTAAVVQLLVYLVPHSVLGSELDYTKME